MLAGHCACKITQFFALGNNINDRCDCDLGAIDGCKARREAIVTALMEATAPDENAKEIAYMMGAR